MVESKMQLRIKVLDFLELAYKEDAGLTTAIIKSRGAFTLKIDDTGSATVTSSIGRISYSLSNDDLQTLTGKISRASLSFTTGSRGTMNYTGSIRLGFADITLSSQVDLFKLIQACSGWLCQAARAYNGRQKKIDHAIDRNIYGAQ